MKYLLLVLIALFFVSCSSAKYSVTKEPEGKSIIKGVLSWEDWQEEAGWSSYASVGYTPNKSITKDIAEYVISKNLSFVIFAGSWCGDSETELPKIYKLLTLAGVFNDRIELWGVDREKLEPSGNAEFFKIEKVPTVIVMTGEKEIGRVVEMPKTSWDSDIMEIIRNYVFK
ncbi:MAG: thioredoxin family protein [Bacteroidota bacterium]|jgi:hypothetical protein